MNRTQNILVVTIVTIIILALAGWYIFLSLIGEVFKEECDKTNEWKIEDYTIVELTCLGWAGPHRFPAHLYHEGTLIGSQPYKLDSCHYEFTTIKGITLYFDVCEMSMKHKQSINQIEDTP